MNEEELKPCPFCGDKAKLQARIKELEENGITLETQNRIREHIIKTTGISENACDGGGCDSGDPVDLTLAEISLGINYLIDRYEDRIKELEEQNEKLGSDVDFDQVLAGQNLVLNKKVKELLAEIGMLKMEFKPESGE